MTPKNHDVPELSPLDDHSITRLINELERRRPWPHAPKTTGVKWDVLKTLIAIGLSVGASWAALDRRVAVLESLTQTVQANISEIKQGMQETRTDIKQLLQRSGGWR